MVYGLDEIGALGAVCPQSRHGLPHGRRPLRQRARRARLQPGRDDLEAGRRHPLLRRHQERRPDGGGHRGVRPDLAESLGYRSKRAGQIISKGRLIAAQFEGYFGSDHWLDNARHANRMAQTLSEGLSAFRRRGSPGRGEANEVFPIIPKTLDRTLKAAGIHYNPWTELSLPETERVADHEILIRLVTSWATREDDVRRLLQAASSGSSREAAEVDLP